ncbi:protein phosphatase 1 regulatory subunit 21-like isoform X1 [Mercenaria mercenaria]|uniref:protein phosphatase 1 regulatory subunit 21-like isoform X1 n=1 Tax=Mercenaria mercenaria TaxID=6596 RepID=UPI00234ECD22|nr:protein phosphatase 1 regulatory subunit 21-like isoform X1 [Mercenaria mercenaria]
MSSSEEKYRKLATEYAKLKAQIPVLKKAYLDEQAAHNELKNEFKEREQTVRKFEQEVDSLSFRNQQLSSRCSFLQDELEAADSKKKHKHKESPSHHAAPVSPGIFSEELQNKIEENARLHQQLSEGEAKYSAELDELKQKLKHFERQCDQHEAVLNATVQKNKTQIDKLQEEKAMLEVKLQTIETEIKNYKSRTEKAETLLGTVENDLKDQLNLANKIIADKLPFVDTKNPALNGLNLPTHDRRHQLRSRELVNQSANLLGEVIQALSNFYTYTEQRSQIYPADGKVEPISPVNIQFCKLLHENLSHLRPVEQSLKEFLTSFKEDALTTLETATGLQPFARNVKKMVAYMNKILPYQLSSLEEECAVSSCTSMLESKNMELHRSLKKLNAVFNKLDTITSLLAAQSTKSCAHSPTNHPRMFSILCNYLTDLHEVVREVSKHYNAKVSLEHQMPTATQRLKTTDECVVSSLISLVTSTGKFSTFLSGNKEFFSQRAGYRTRGSSIGVDPGTQSVRSNPATVNFRQKAAQYIALLSKPCPESVPHHVAVQNRKVLLSSAESREGLAKQIETFQQKVSKLEQEKEHWMLEQQLMKIKFENETEKNKKLEKELENSSHVEQITSIQDNIETPVPVRKGTDSDKRLDVTMLGKVEMSTKPTGVVDTREMLIKNHFSTRINELTQQLQLSDSKCVSFHAEVRALHKQLQMGERAKKQAEDELKAMSQTYAQLKDELSTTSKNYESQLSMMSDHLAGMNEKLTQQKDEIDELKSQISNAKSSSSSSHSKFSLKKSRK